MTLSGHRCHFCPSSGQIPEAHLSLCLLSSLPPCCTHSSSCMLLELALPAGPQLQLLLRGAGTDGHSPSKGYWEQFVPRVQCIPGQQVSSLALWGHFSLLTSPGPSALVLPSPVMNECCTKQVCKRYLWSLLSPYIWLSYSLDPTMSVHPAHTGGPVQTSQCLCGEAHSETMHIPEKQHGSQTYSIQISTALDCSVRAYHLTDGPSRELHHFKWQLLFSHFRSIDILR